MRGDASVSTKYSRWPLYFSELCGCYCLHMSSIMDFNGISNIVGNNKMIIATTSGALPGYEQFGEFPDI